MESLINLWAVLGSAIASFIVGMIWYHPKVFGKAWMHMSGITLTEANKLPVSSMVGGFAMNCILAYVLAYFSAAWGVWDVIGAIELSLWIWVGFMGVPMLMSVFYERKPVKLWAINAGYWLVVLIVSSIIISLWV